MDDLDDDEKDDAIRSGVENVGHLLDVIDEMQNIEKSLENLSYRLKNSFL